MRRIAIILLACLCCLCVFTSCAGPEDSATETVADGAYVPITDEKGNITGYERKYHNDNGDITHWDVYNANEVYDHYVNYEYDSNGRLGKETYYQADGIGVYYYAYSYYEDGTLAEKDYVTMKEGSKRIMYDEKGKEKERFTYDRDDVLTKYEVYENDAWKEAEPPTVAPDATE